MKRLKRCTYFLSLVFITKCFTKNLLLCIYILLFTLLFLFSKDQMVNDIITGCIQIFSKATISYSSLSCI